MKEIKVQQDILAMVQTPHRVRFGKLKDGRTGAVIDGMAVYIICSDNLMIGTAKFMSMDLNDILDCVVEAKNIIPTGVSIINGKDTLKEFKNDDTTAYFNEKRFKYFDSKKTLTYSYHKSKLFVFENGELVGLLVETRVKK